LRRKATRRRCGPGCTATATLRFLKEGGSGLPGKPREGGDEGDAYLSSSHALLCKTIPLFLPLHDAPLLPPGCGVTYYHVMEDIYDAFSSSLSSSSHNPYSLGRLTRQVNQKTRASLRNYLMSIYYDSKVTAVAVMVVVEGDGGWW